MTSLVFDNANIPAKILNATQTPEIAPKKRFMAGFHEFLNRHIGGSADYEFTKVIDLGGVFGACQHCGTPIRYEFYVLSKSKGEEFILGSTCITKVEWISRHLHLSTDEFLKMLNKKAKTYKDDFKREDNRERYHEFVEFLEAFLKYNYEWSARSALYKINKGEKLTNEEIAYVRGRMETTDLSELKKKYDEVAAQNSKSFEEKKKSDDEVRGRYEKLMIKTIELSKYVTSPFMLDMARKFKQLNGKDLLISIPTNFSDNQLSMLEEAVKDYDLEKLELERETTEELRAEQKLVLDGIIHRFEVGEVSDFEMTGRDGKKSSYRAMFESIRLRVEKRPMTEREQAVVDKFTDKNGKDFYYKRDDKEKEIADEHKENGDKTFVDDKKKVESLLNF